MCEYVNGMPVRSNDEALRVFARCVEQWVRKAADLLVQVEEGRATVRDVARPLFCLANDAGRLASLIADEERR